MPGVLGKSFHQNVLSWPFNFSKYQCLEKNANLKYSSALLFFLTEKGEVNYRIQFLPRKKKTS